MIRQFAAGLLELAAEALRPPVTTQAQEEERARLVEVAEKWRKQVVDLVAQLARERECGDVRCGKLALDLASEKSRADAAEATVAAFREREPDDCDCCGNPMDGNVCSTSDVCIDCWNARVARIAELEQQLAQSWIDGTCGNLPQCTIEYVIGDVRVSTPYGGEQKTWRVATLYRVVANEKEADGHDA